MKNRSFYLLLLTSMFFATLGFADENIFGIDKKDLSDKIANSFNLPNITDLTLSYNTKYYDVTNLHSNHRLDNMTETESHIIPVSAYQSPFFYYASTTYNKIVGSESPKDVAAYRKLESAFEDADRGDEYEDGLRDLNSKTEWQAKYVPSTIDSNQAKIPIQITFKNGQNAYSCLATQHILSNQSNFTIYNCNNKKLKLVLLYNVEPNHYFTVQFDDGKFSSESHYFPWSESDFIYLPHANDEPVTGDVPRTGIQKIRDY